MAYNKINWENGKIEQDGYVNIDGVRYPITMPEYSGETPVNADNLNHMDEGIANLYPTVLYENGSGDNSNITLNDDVVNYSYIEIFYRNNNYLFGYLKVFSPNGKQVNIISSNPSSGWLWLKSTNLSISGTSINPIYYGEAKLGNSQGTWVTTTNNIYITMVLGYK